METLSIFPEYTILFTEGAERKKWKLIENIVYVCDCHLTLTFHYLEHILKVLSNMYLIGLLVPERKSTRMNLNSVLN